MADAAARYGAAARTGARRGVRHHADQRAQGVRHRARGGTRLGAGRRHRGGARHVARVVRRRQRLRARLGARGVPVRAHGAAARAHRAARAQRGAVVIRFARTWLAPLLALGLGLAWLVPTLGLFATSLLPPQSFQDAGWWTLAAHPALATL